ncbi:MAG: choice-of-anchor D domain-containing protein [Candidatus Acidiferrales bacterium]
MSRTRYFYFLFTLTGCASMLVALNAPVRSAAPFPASQSQRNCQPRRRAIPLTFEANLGQADSRVAFLARGPHLATFLTRDGIEIDPAGATQQHIAPKRIRIEFTQPSSNSAPPSRPRKNKVAWRGIERLRAESNYFIGRNRARWRTHLPHFARAEARAIVPGVDLVIYGSDVTRNKPDQIEFDLQIAPGTDVEQLRIKISGTDAMRLNSSGDLQMQVGGSQVRMHKPALYEETLGREVTGMGTDRMSPPRRSPIDGAYVVETDGSIGFRTGRRNPHATLVIDPSLSVAYSTFLGGGGEDSANSIALDAAGNLYVGGTTTSASTFSEVATKQNGPGDGATDFFVAKIDPAATGASSLIYLTFLGGSGAENGGMVAVDKSGNLAITGTTTSPDFPVTDGSKFTGGSNDIALAELGPTGATVVYSTLFGGNGSESTQNPGGIAIDQVGEIFVSSDTTSTDLPVTAGAFQVANGGGASDGFLAVFRPAVAPHLKYCTYFGIDAQVGVGGVAIDAGGNAYVAGFTSDPGTTFPTLDGYQTTYAGGPFDAFLIKIRPSGTGASDLAYGTFLGGAGLDKALAIAVSAAMPATAYVTGTTQSTNFPTNGASAAAQPMLKGTANAFFSTLAQDATTGMTSLFYSTYVGGTQSDSGLSVSAVAPAAVYVAGKTTSWDFPWLNNFQPFNGNEDAFVVKLNPTAAGAASLLYATPLAGTAPSGGTAAADGNAIAAGTAGQVYVAGRTTAADFPRAGNPGNGMQLICASCQELPPAADAFVLAFQESAASRPSVSFTALNINFGAQSVGAQNIPPLFASVINTGDAPLNVSSIAVSGPDSASFAFIGSDPCIGTPLQPRATCTFEVSFSPTAVGPAEGFVTVEDDAPGSPQVLAVVGIGSGPLAMLSPSSLNFGSQPQGSSSLVKAVTVTNAGNQSLQITQVLPPQQNFKIKDDSCTQLGNMLAAGASCEVDLVFSPPGIGLYSAELDVFDDSGNAIGAKQVIPLSGTGTAAAPIVSILPPSLVFGSQPVGKLSGSQIVTVLNQGSAALTLAQIGIVGPDAASFGIVSAGANPCPAAGGVVATSGTCTVGVDFAPQTSGFKNASLSFVDNVAGSPQLIALSGTAIAPTMQISPTALNFAPQSAGTPSAPQTITVSNTGNTTVTINQISVAGVNASDFNETNNCSAVLGAGGSCMVSVTFKPIAAGNCSASILVSDNATGNPHTVPLSGTATQSAVMISPSSANFAGQLVGTPSQPVAITITNSGNGALLIGSVSFSGANAADFLEENSCKGTVVPGGNCMINVTFTPAVVGARSATLVLADNAPDSPQSVPLTGAAMDFDIDPPGIGATSATVLAGQTANYQLDLRSMNGFAGTVTFTCSGAPVGAVCSILPATVAVSANASVPFQVSVSTTARQLNANSPQNALPAAASLATPSFPVHFSSTLTSIDTEYSLAPDSESASSPGAIVTRSLAVGPPANGQFTARAAEEYTGTSRLLYLILLVGILMAPSVFRSRCRLETPTFLQFTPAIALALLLAATTISCVGGSGGAVAPSSGTPASTSTIIVRASTTATSAATRALSLTLTVQ